MEPIIQLMADMMSSMECKTKEQMNPKLQLQPDYTKTEKAIVEMLIENTGCDILDSGGAYGRNWERNRHVQDFRNRHATHVIVNKDGSIDFTTDVFHFLVDRLDASRRSEGIQKWFDRYATNNHLDDGWSTTIDAFYEERLKKRGWKHIYGENTYNRDSSLSQILQYDVFEDNYWGNFYVILQIHNGCDARGGYTKPKIFEINMNGGSEYCLTEDENVHAQCACTTADSDDYGYNWCVDGWWNDGKFPTKWIIKENEIQGEPNYEFICTNCLSIVQWW